MTIPFHYERMNRYLAYDRWMLIQEADGYREVRLELMLRTWSLKEVSYRTLSWEVSAFLKDPLYFGTLVRSKLLKEIEKLDAAQD